MSGGVLRVHFVLQLVDRGPSGGVRLGVQTTGEVLGASAARLPGAPLGAPLQPVAPLRAARLLQLVGARIEGALYHPVSRCYSFPLAAHAALVAALARPLTLLPPPALLYQQSPLALDAAALAPRAGESELARTRRLTAARRDAEAHEYEQLGAAQCWVDALPPGLVAHMQAVAGEPMAPGPPVPGAAPPAAGPPPAHVPAALWQKLFFYQHDGVWFLVRRRRVIVGDEMGCGKTLQTVAATLHCLGEAARLEPGRAATAIVIVPSALREQWRREFVEHGATFGGPNGLEVAAPRTSRDAVATRGVTIVSYDMCARPELFARLGALHACTVVIDEAHYIKTAEAQRTRAVATLAASARAVFCLSGTPALSRPMELFVQLNLVAPHLWRGDRHAFGVRYCDARQRIVGGRETWQYLGATKLDELNIVLRTCMVRRLKRDVLAHLPPKFRERVFLALDDAGRAEIATMRANVEAARAAVGAGGGEMQENAALMAAVRHTARVKLPAVLRYLDEVVLEHGQHDADDEWRAPRFLFFAHHLPVLDGVEKHLTARGLRTMRIDGATPAEERTRGIDAFQAGSLDAAILSITAAGAGVTLTKARLVVFGELHWNFSAVNQAEDRAHRIGQEEPVRVQYLVASDSTDDVMYAAMCRKFSIMSLLLDGAPQRLQTGTQHQAALGSK